jgi:hypothetical protein
MNTAKKVCVFLWYVANFAWFILFVWPFESLKDQEKEND